MLRAVSRCYLEGPGLDLLVFRRDALKGFRSGLHSTAVHAKQSRKPKAKKYRTTVLVSEPSGGGGSCPAPPAPAPPPAQPPPPPPRRGRAIAAAVAVGTSLAGIYFFKKLSEEKDDKKHKVKDSPSVPALPPPYPALASDFPAHVQYLVVGGGTAAFAALRAIRSHRPNAQVLLVSEERALPYMRPPLSKELWQEEDLSEAAKHPDKLSFKQWNGRRRSITYEPEAFYTPVEKLAATAPSSPGSSPSEPGEARGGVGVARGWSVKKLDVAAHQAVLEAGAQGRTISYDKCLIATGVVPRRIPALAPAATAGLSQPVRTVADVARGARALARPGVARVAVVGGGLLGTELTAALCQRLSGSSTQVVQIFREGAALSRVLPAHLADDVTRRLRGNHANVLADTEVLSSSVVDGRVRLHLSTGESLDVDYVFECAGSTPDTRVAAASRLELDPALGGVLVNAELSARTDVYAAGDVACFYDEMLGRRRVEHHDHAVVSGRLAGENMAAAGPAKHYTHQSMFWSDLGPELGYEAIGIIDSSLQTVSVFAEDAITTVAENTAETAVAETQTAVADAQTAVAEKPKTEEKKYNRGVVFYLRDNRIVGVLLYNLFNRLHVARQVLSVGEFDDLLEVGKLFMLKVEEPEEES
ncbi:hypothetical protein JYU34_009998 [Plutella xylostella]|uniref:Apoptosis-inducing factor 1, mitochondrial n=1 Tax=Plutella xylostella TaxID=51655 RepID=A0ABQ7QHF6_PLUXY|nr:hypothetical protein JYU34_009998 [Plutella xylostella]